MQDSVILGSPDYPIGSRPVCLTLLGNLHELSEDGDHTPTKLLLCQTSLHALDPTRLPQCTWPGPLWPYHNLTLITMTLSRSNYYLTTQKQSISLYFTVVLHRIKTDYIVILWSFKQGFSQGWWGGRSKWSLWSTKQTVMAWIYTFIIIIYVVCGVLRG